MKSKRVILSMVMIFCGINIIFAQEKLIQRLNAINEKLVVQYNEKVFVQTDRDLYELGDTINVRAFLFSNSLNNEDLQKSRFVYIDLVDKDGVVKNREKILYDSLSNSFMGYVRMYDNIDVGEYELQAYTYWMQNNGVKSFFRKKVYVINGSKTDISIVSDKCGDAESGIKFFPEGGELIAGFAQKIGFISMGNEHGTIGYVKDDNGEKIADIVADQNGYGVITLTPESGNSYVAVVKLREGIESSISLPDVKENSAYALTLERAGDNNISYKILHTDDVTLLDKYILVYNSDAFFGLSKAKESGVIKLDSTVTTDIIKFALVDEIGKVFSSRAWYYADRNKPLAELNVATVTDSQQLSSISLNVGDGSELDESMDLAISIIPLEELYGTSMQKGVSSYVNLTSEFDYQIANPDCYLTDENRLNDLLISKRYEFKDLSEVEEWLKSCENGPFIREEDMILEGYIVNRKGKPVTNNIVERSGKLIRNGVVSLEGDDDMIYFIYPDNNGYFKRGEVLWDNEIRFFSEYECFMGNRTIYLDLVEPTFLNKFDYAYLAKQNTRPKVDKHSTEWTDRQARTVVRKSLQGIDMYMPLSMPAISGGPVYTSYKNPELPYSATAPKGGNRAVRSYIKVETKPSMRRLISFAPQRRRNVEGDGETATWQRRVVVTSQQPFTLVLPDKRPGSKGYAVIINGVDSNGNPVEKIVLTN